jgi:hypothetical protein
MITAEDRMSIPGINFKGKKKNPRLDAESSIFELTFYKDREYFSVMENLNNFVKSVEALCRKSKYYKRYVKFIKEDVQLDCCQVLSNVEVNEDSGISLEMHHGPILTLYDYCVIIIDTLLAKEYDQITTFRVADIIMREHYMNNIQVVMLTKTVHEAVDEGLFLNYKQGFGNLGLFLKKYKDGISKDQIFKINAYIRMCEDYNSFDNMLLALKDRVKEWSQENII